MRVLFVSSEVEPFARTGGLGDVSGALPAALDALGHDIAVFTPFYRETRLKGFDARPMEVKLDIRLRDKTVSAGLALAELPGSGVKVYLLRCDDYYDRAYLYRTPEGDDEDNAERFIFMCRACLEAVRALGLDVDVIHANDWQAALIPVYLKTLYAADERLAGVATLLTIHNLAYQGLFWHWDMPLTGLGWEHFNWRELEYFGRMNLLKGGIVFADVLNTVSKTYAREIQTRDGGVGLEDVLRARSEDLHGIVNGIDYSVWDPSVDEVIPQRFSPHAMEGKAACKRALQEEAGLAVDPEAPLVGFIGRLTAQKGLDIFTSALPRILGLGCQMVVLGTGEDAFERLVARAAREHPRQVALTLAFDNALAHRIEAGCDMFLMPSRFEPCGLNQLYSLRYGTVPIVRSTGGLADTIVPYTPTGLRSGSSNGFVFSAYTPDALYAAVEEALTVFRDPAAWSRLVQNGMGQDWSWSHSAREYEKLYRKAVRAPRSATRP